MEGHKVNNKMDSHQSSGGFRSVSVNGEIVDGFSIVSVPEQIDGGDEFDPEALSAIAGMRAIWLLYRRGEWDKLEALGLDRQKMEPRLKKYRFGKTGIPLEPEQVRRLTMFEPDLVSASKVLRVAYLLEYKSNTSLIGKKDILEESKDDMYTYLAHVSSPVEGRAIVRRYSTQVESMGTNGIIESDGESIRIMLSYKVEPENLFPDSGLTFELVRGMQIKIPQPKQEE